VRKDLPLLVLGRFAQALLTIASLRVLTAFLSPAQVGSVFLILSIASAFGLFLVNPVGMYINRKLHAWQQEKSIFSHFFLFNIYVTAVSLLSLAVVWGGKHFLGIGSELPVIPLLLVVACYVYAVTWNMTLVPALNMLQFRASFVIFSVLTSGLALALSSVLVARGSPTAISWVSGQAVALLFIAVVAAVALKNKLGESFAAPSLPEMKSKRFRDLWHFALPLSGATLFMWIQNQSYRVIVEKLAGPEILGFLAVGLGVALSLSSVVDALVQQLYSPEFYKKLHSGVPGARQLAPAEFAAKALPVYFILALFTFFMSPHLIRLLVDPKFQGAWKFVAVGAFIELFRLISNLFAAGAHAEMKTSSLVTPYFWGGSFTAIAVTAACLLGARGVMLPVVMALGGLITLILVMRGMMKISDFKIEKAPILKSILWSCGFAPALLIGRQDSLVRAMLVAALFGLYYLFIHWWMLVRKNVPQ
jgi:O-antigen/teichoic acid export membrane protein